MGGGGCWCERGFGGGSVKGTYFAERGGGKGFGGVALVGERLVRAREGSVMGAAA